MLSTRYYYIHFAGRPHVTILRSNYSLGLLNSRRIPPTNHSPMLGPRPNNQPTMTNSSSQIIHPHWHLNSTWHDSSYEHLIDKYSRLPPNIMFIRSTLFIISRWSRERSHVHGAFFFLFVLCFSKYTSYDPNGYPRWSVKHILVSMAAAGRKRMRCQ